MSDVFFYLSKVFWFFVSPDHFLVFLLVISCVFALIGWKKCAIWFGVSAIIPLFILCFYPLGYLALEPLERWSKENSSLPSDIAGIIVLGGAEAAALSVQHQQPHFNNAAERVMTIPVLRKRYPEVPILFTGGSGLARQQQYKEADVVRQWLALIGITEQVYFEGRSRNTFENAIYADEVFDKSKGTYLLVTSAFHVPRSVAVFQAQGWSIAPYGVDYRVDQVSAPRSLWLNLSTLSIGVHEWLGLIAYRLSHRTSTFFPH